jgi:hypothetical protein
LKISSILSRPPKKRGAEAELVNKKLFQQNQMNEVALQNSTETEMSSGEAEINLNYLLGPRREYKLPGNEITKFASAKKIWILSKVAYN